LKARPRSAHQLLCHWLSGALGRKLTATELPANEAEWQNVLRLSGTHLVTPLLGWAAREQGLISMLPSDVREYLDAVCALNLHRNRQCEDQLIHLAQVLNSIDVRPVLLKGAAALVSGLYPTSAERIITDIDVLIPAQRLPDILDRLGIAGYQPVAEEGGLPKAENLMRQHHHYPPLQSPDWPAKVELHVHPVDLSATRLLSAAEVSREAKPVPWRGGELSLPSPTHFLMHNVIHAFVVDFRDLAFLSLRQLFEFVHSNRVYSDRIDWPAIVVRFDSQGYEGALRGYGAFANAYLGFQAPPALTLDGWERWRPILHRIRMDLSHPAIELPLAIAMLMQLRTRNLLRAPGKLKRLFSREFYRRNWQHVRNVSRHNASWRSTSQGRSKTRARSPG
jgi:hypothetical protein